MEAKAPKTPACFMIARFRAPSQPLSHTHRGLEESPFSEGRVDYLACISLRPLNNEDRACSSYGG